VDNLVSDPNVGEFWQKHQEVVEKTKGKRLQLLTISPPEEHEDRGAWFKSKVQPLLLAISALLNIASLVFKLVDVGEFVS